MTLPMRQCSRPYPHSPHPWTNYTEGRGYCEGVPEERTAPAVESPPYSLVDAIARALYVYSDREGREERDRAWRNGTIPEAMKTARRDRAAAMLAAVPEKVRV